MMKKKTSSEYGWLIDWNINQIQWEKKIIEKSRMTWIMDYRYFQSVIYTNNNSILNCSICR